MAKLLAVSDILVWRTFVRHMETVHSVVMFTFSFSRTAYTLHDELTNELNLTMTMVNKMAYR